jgi:mRNA-degrading endonuclease RelE of RelBE toxin-antitoxin system
MYELVYAESIQDDLRHIDRKYHSAIRDAIAEQLRFSAHLETRNRKPLDPSIRDAAWELRCGLSNRFRVLYSFELPSEENSETPPKVFIKAIGEKRGNTLYIAGEDVNL